MRIQVRAVHKTLIHVQKNRGRGRRDLHNSGKEETKIKIIYLAEYTNETFLSLMLFLIYFDISEDTWTNVRRRKVLVGGLTKVLF